VLCAAGSLAAQVPIGQVTVVPMSATHPDALGWWAESPDGRFYVATRAAGTNERYDRTTGRWEPVPELEIGPNPVWSPNGRFIAFHRTSEGERDPYIWIQPMDPATGWPNGTARRVSNVLGTFPSWSPNSRRLAFLSNSPQTYRLMVMPFNGGDAETLFEAPGEGGFTAWSPDGQYVSSVHGPGRLALRVNVATKGAQEFPAPMGQLIGYSRDGARLAYFDFMASLISVTSAASGELLQRVQVPHGTRNPAWSRASPGEIMGHQLLIPSHLQMISLPGGQMRALGPIEPSNIAWPRFSPDGRRLAYLRDVDGLRQVHVAGPDGSGARALGERGDIDRLAWSPAGTHIAYLTGASGLLRVIDVAAGSDRVLVQPGDEVARPGAALQWRIDGQAVRYVWRPQGAQTVQREIREVTLAGADRLLTIITSLTGQPTFVNDTLLLLLQGDGVDGVDLRTGELRRLYTGGTRGDNSGFGVSRDGEWVVFAGREGTRYPDLTYFPVMLSLRTGQSRRIPNALGGQIFAVQFHPDGRNLVVEECLTCAEDIEKWDVVLLPLNGDPGRVLTSGQPSYRGFEQVAV
jgi:Tol biopolymer transport system component